MIMLPNLEVVAAKVHQCWIQGKLDHGVVSRRAEDGEELMVPYEKLSERQKEQDRCTVRAVYHAISEAEAEQELTGAQAAWPFDTQAEHHAA